jgi:hypothetical protein
LGVVAFRNGVPIPVIVHIEVLQAQFRGYERYGRDFFEIIRQGNLEKVAACKQK